MKHAPMPSFVDPRWYQSMIVDGCPIVAHRGDFVDLSWLGNRRDWQLLLFAKNSGRDLSCCEVRHNVWRVHVLARVGRNNRLLDCELTDDADPVSVIVVARRMIAAAREKQNEMEREYGCG